MAKLFALFGVFLMVAGSVALSGFLLMLLLGIGHHEVHEGIPALGFWISTAIALLLRLVWWSLFRSSSS